MSEVWINGASGEGLVVDSERTLCAVQWRARALAIAHESVFDFCITEQIMAYV